MNKTVIVICGPTASGKTEIASCLCDIIGGEIISADSRQVYKYLDIGTNKSGTYNAKKRIRETASGTAQHLIDLIDPNEIYTTGDFVSGANNLIMALKNTGKVPVVVGGTGLYIKALVNGLAPMPEKNDMIRAELKDALNKHGKDHLYRELKAVDPVSADKNRSNPQRLIRALEIFRITGKPISYWHSETAKPEWDFIQYAPLLHREDLYSNINKRSQSMLDSGMIEETERTLSLGYVKDSPGFGSLGYRHIINHLYGLLTREQVKELISLDTRRYAKRQMTWFRGVPDISWIEMDRSPLNPTEIAKTINKQIKNML